MFEKLARSCRKPDIDFMQMQNSILDRFLDLEKKSGKVKKSGSQIGDNFLFKLQSFSSKVSKSWWPRSESDEEKINYIHKELLRFAVENASLEENIKDLYYLLEENKTEL